MDDLKTRIAAGHEIKNELTHQSVSAVSQLILEILNESADASNSNEFWNATDLFRSLAIGSRNPTRIAEHFRKSYLAGEQRAIVEQLELGLSHANVFIRKHSIYTLGKIGSLKSVGEMLKAFDRAIQDDPVVLSRLVQEIRWIIGSVEEAHDYEGVYDQMLERLVESDSYLNRWIAVDIIQSQSTMPGHRRDLLEKLGSDTHPFVRFQAANESQALKKRVYIELVTQAFPTKKAYSVAQFDRFVNESVQEHAPELIGTG